MSEAALPLGASLGSPRQGRMPTGRAVRLGEKPGPEGEYQCSLLRLGPLSPSSTVFTEPSFVLPQAALLGTRASGQVQLGAVNQLCPPT